MFGPFWLKHVEPNIVWLFFSTLPPKRKTNKANIQIKLRPFLPQGPRAALPSPAPPARHFVPLVPDIGVVTAAIILCLQAVAVEEDRPGLEQAGGQSFVGIVGEAFSRLPPHETWSCDPDKGTGQWYLLLCITYAMRFGPALSLYSDWFAHGICKVKWVLPEMGTIVIFGWAIYTYAMGFSRFK